MTTTRPNKRRERISALTERRQRGAGIPGLFSRCAQHGRCLGGESPTRNQVIEIEANRNCRRATDCGKEAGSETAGRCTRTGYEAPSSGASRPRTAKLR